MSAFRPQWRLTSALNLFLAFSIAVASPAAAQESPAETFAERIDVRLLNIEAVVSDRDGVRIPGLAKDDFRLMVDGEEVPIEFFTEVREGEVVASETGIPGLGAGEPAGISFLVFIDEFFPLERDKKRVLTALAERAESLRPADRAAVVAWNGEELDVLSGWTSSGEELRRTLDAAIERPGLGLQRQQEQRRYSVSMDTRDRAARAARRAYDPYRLGTQERMYADLLAHQLQATVGAAAAAMRGLENPVGRKALLLLSGGWPHDIATWVGGTTRSMVSEPNIPAGAAIYDSLATTANLLGYTIYAVDMPGLQSGSGVDASMRAPMPSRAASEDFFLEGEVHNSLRYLAAETGGRALLNGMRVAALSEVRDDVRSNYWLGWSPRWASDDTRHDLEVAVKDPDLRVRARAGYTDLSPRTQVAMAVESTLLYGPFETSEELEIAVRDVEKAGRGKLQGTLEVSLPYSAVTPIQTADGWQVQAVLFVAALDEDGGRSEVSATPLVVTSKRKPRGSDRLAYETAIVGRKKTRQVAVAVLDVVSGEILATALRKE